MGKGHGQVFVQVKSFRHYEDESFPNFAIVTDKLPGLQEKLSSDRDEEKVKNLKPVLEPFADAITRGLPLNQQDWNKSLQVSDRLALFKQGFVTEKEGLYYFTDKAKDLFQNEV